MKGPRSVKAPGATPAKPQTASTSQRRERERPKTDEQQANNKRQTPTRESKEDEERRLQPAATRVVNLGEPQNNATHRTTKATATGDDDASHRTPTTIVPMETGDDDDDNNNDEDELVDIISDAPTTWADHAKQFAKPQPPRPKERSIIDKISSAADDANIAETTRDEDNKLAPFLVDDEPRAATVLLPGFTRSQDGESWVETSRPEIQRRVQGLLEQHKDENDANFKWSAFTAPGVLVCSAPVSPSSSIVDGVVLVFQEAYIGNGCCTSFVMPPKDLLIDAQGGWMPGLLKLLDLPATLAGLEAIRSERQLKYYRITLSAVDTEIRESYIKRLAELQYPLSTTDLGYAKHGLIASGRLNMRQFITFDRGEDGTIKCLNDLVTGAGRAKIYQDRLSTQAKQLYQSGAVVAPVIGAHSSIDNAKHTATVQIATRSSQLMAVTKAVLEITADLFACKEFSVNFLSLRQRKKTQGRTKNNRPGRKEASGK